MFNKNPGKYCFETVNNFLWQVMFAVPSKSLENSVELMESYTVTSEAPVALTSVGNWASGLKLII